MIIKWRPHYQCLKCYEMYPEIKPIECKKCKHQKFKHVIAQWVHLNGIWWNPFSWLKGYWLELPAKPPIQPKYICCKDKDLETVRKILKATSGQLIAKQNINEGDELYHE